MKQYLEILFDYKQCRKETAELRALLDAKDQLSERKDVLNFFKERQQLCALCGILNSHIARADRVALEFPLYGDFACDLVVADWQKKTFCFIEFEDARPDSIFKRLNKKKADRDWSPRFEHGYSQIIDWFHKLDRVSGEERLQRFGKLRIDYNGALVIGRLHHLNDDEKMRLEWRRDHVVVHSKHIRCVTFDELLQDLEARLDTLALYSEATQGGKAGK